MNFSGHDQPFPNWFPYVFGAILVLALIVYYLIS